MHLPWYTTLGHYCTLFQIEMGFFNPVLYHDDEDDDDGYELDAGLIIYIVTLIMCLKDDGVYG